MPDIWTIIVGFVLIAVFRPGLERLIASLARLLARPFTFVEVSICRPVSHALTGHVKRAISALTPNAPGDSENSWLGWQVIRTIVYFLLSSEVVLSGGYTILLRLAALTHFDAPLIQGHGIVATLQAFELGGALILNSIALFDPYIRHPSDGDRDGWLHKAALVGACTAVATTMLLFLWGQRAIEGANDWPLSLLIVTMMGLLSALAAVVGHRAFVSIWTILFAVVLSVPLTIASITGSASALSVAVIKKTTDVILVVVKTLSLPGNAFGLWIARFPWFREVLKIQGSKDDLWEPLKIDWEDSAAAQSTGGNSE